MSNMHRIGWFDQQIRAAKYPNAGHLAREFEISRRQAARDIEYMEMSLRAPLNYVAKNRGYCYLDETFILPYIYMTDEEKKVLKYLAHRYRQYSYDNAEPVRRIARLLDRFAEGDGGDNRELARLPMFDADPRIVQTMQLLSHAISDGLTVHLRYKDPEGERQFHVAPFRFVSRYHADYVLVYEAGYDRPFSLRLDGIDQLSIGEAAGTVGEFKPDAEDHLPLRQPFVAKVKLLDRLEGTSWRGYPARSVGRMVYEVDFHDTDSFLQHLLVAGWEELLAPRWLREKLRSKCTEILDRTKESTS